MSEPKVTSVAAASPYPKARPFDLVEDISYQQFVSDYALPRRPVVVRGAFGHLEAAALTPESMKERWGSKLFEYDGKETPLAEIIDRTEQSTPEQPTPYFRSLDIESSFPEMIPLLSGGVKYAWPNYRFLKRWLPSRYFRYGGHWAEFFLGGHGNGFPFLHVDTPPMNTFIANFYGEKEWIIFDPADRDNLYMDDRDFTHTDGPKIFDPDFDKYPKLLDSRPTVVRQQAGDLIFVPTNAIHTARNLSTTISIAWDQLARSSWGEYIDSKYRYTVTKQPAKAVLANVYLKSLGWFLGIREMLAGRFGGEKMRGRII